MVMTQTILRPLTRAELVELETCSVGVRCVCVGTVATSPDRGWGLPSSHTVSRKLGARPIIGEVH